MASNVVADCSSIPYCTKPDTSLSYNMQFIISWNNHFPPLNKESDVELAVYSQYDLSTPIFQTITKNTNGMYTLIPTAQWFGKYTGNNENKNGQNQIIYFSARLNGDPVPPVKGMLELRITATDAQYQEIQQILHPQSSSASNSHVSNASTEDTLSNSMSSSSSSSSSTLLSDNLTTHVSELESSSSSEAPAAVDRSDGLSGGAIAGIVVGSVVGLLLLLLLLIIPLWRKRQRRKRMLAKSAAIDDSAGAGGNEAKPSLLSSTSSSDNVNRGGATLAAAAGAAAAGAATLTNSSQQHPVALEKTTSGTPLLHNRSSTAGDDAASSLVDNNYQPLSLESPRILMHMPSSSTRSNILRSPSTEDPILSSDEARQIGDSFRDAMRRPVTSDLSDHEEELAEENDPHWRERVANERMHRELAQEASVIRSVARRAHGGSSEYSASSRPDTGASTTKDENE